MKSKNRIFLKTNNELREFLWLQQGPDGSIYVGNASKLSNGRKGLLHANKDDASGTSLRIDGGEIQNQGELARKWSFHKSGYINLPTINADNYDRLHMKEFAHYEGALPLLNIVPMLPTRYPLSSKTVKKNDLVIDCGVNQGKCIGIVVFVAFSEPHARLFTRLREEGLSISMISANIYDRKLCAMLYFDGRFQGWPKVQVTVTPHPEDGGEMPWTVVIPSYEA